MDDEFDCQLNADGVYHQKKVKLIVLNHRLKQNQAILALNEDQEIEFAVEVDKQFKVDIDGKNEVIEVKVKNVTFNMNAGNEAQNFVAELFRLQEKSSVERNDFSWMPSIGQKFTIKRDEEEGKQPKMRNHWMMTGMIHVLQQHPILMTCLDFHLILQLLFDQF